VEKVLADTKTVYDRLELCTILFKLNFRCRVVAVVFCTMNESIAGLSTLFILGFKSQFEVGCERYEFSMVDLETGTKHPETVN